MNKKTLTEVIALNHHIPKVEADLIITDIFENIFNSLTIDKADVNIAGFGKFKVKSYKVKNARNPRTGEKVAPREVVRVKFSASKNLKEILN